MSCNKRGKKPNPRREHLWPWPQGHERLKRSPRTPLNCILALKVWDVWCTGQRDLSAGLCKIGSCNSRRSMDCWRRHGWAQFGTAAHLLAVRRPLSSVLYLLSTPQHAPTDWHKRCLLRCVVNLDLRKFFVTTASWNGDGSSASFKWQEDRWERGGNCFQFRASLLVTVTLRVRSIACGNKPSQNKKKKNNTICTHLPFLKFSQKPVCSSREPLI